MLNAVVLKVAYVSLALVSALAAGFVGWTPGGGGGGGSAPPSRAQLATGIRDNSRIALATTHVSGIVDTATARQNIVDTANGQPASRSSYGTAPGGTVDLDVRMLQGLTSLANTYTYSVSELAGGSHSEPTSRHYAGVAADFNVINGQQVSASHPDLAAFRQACGDLGATEVKGPGDAGHDTHVHCAWPRP